MMSCMIFYGDQMAGHVRKYYARTEGISQLTKGTSPLQVIKKTIWLVLYFGEENIKNRLKLIFGEISKKIFYERFAVSFMGEQWKSSVKPRFLKYYTFSFHMHIFLHTIPVIKGEGKDEH